MLPLGTTSFIAAEAEFTIKTKRWVYGKDERLGKFGQHHVWLHSLHHDHHLLA